jgi:hypothetical protein
MKKSPAPITMHEHVLVYLQSTKGRWPDVARRSDVPLRTLEKIARQEIRDPSTSRIQKLYDLSLSNEN